MPVLIQEKQMSRILVVLILISSTIPGCIGKDDSISNIEIPQSEQVEFASATIGIIHHGTSQQMENDNSILEFVEELGFNISVVWLESESALLEALRFGTVDFGILDSGNAWIGWKQYGLSAVLAEEIDGSTSQTSHAWVLNNSQIALDYSDEDPLTDPYSSMSGSNACLPGWLSPTGMLAPMGFFLGLGYTDIVGDPNDIESLRFTLQNYFSPSIQIPEPGSPYYGHEGSLRCLSEGQGEVAFVHKMALDGACSNVENLSLPEWCLPLDDYLMLPALAEIPTRTVMYSGDHVEASIVQSLSNSFRELPRSDDIEKISMSSLSVNRLVPTNNSIHLESLGPLVENIPGFSHYYTDDSPGEIIIGIDNLSIGIIREESNDATDPLWLAESLEEKLGITVNIHYSSSEVEIFKELESGVIQIAILDPVYATLGWQHHDLALLGVLEYLNGGSFTDSVAISLKDNSTNLTSFENMTKTGEQIQACFTGFPHSAEFILPLMSLIGEGIVSVESESNQNLTITEVLTSVFSNNSTFQGLTSIDALKCLSEGDADVVFTTEASLNQACNNQNENLAWCHPYGNYTIVANFGEIPASSVMYSPSHLDSRSRAAILNALLSLRYELYLEDASFGGSTYTGCYDISIHVINDTMPKERCGSEILTEVLESGGFVRSNAHGHLVHFYGVTSELISSSDGALIGIPILDKTNDEAARN
ncbi:MAG: Uncharacterised protein [Methanobacteriota archaeon]|nr:MAG: Uncharacterised protein [Euryarchaeota archaeon]